MRRIEWMKSARRPIAITTDIIVGFPGETETDFAATLALLDEVEYDSIFSFKYSRRPIRFLKRKNRAASPSCRNISEPSRSAATPLTSARSRNAWWKDSTKPP